MKIDGTHSSKKTVSVGQLSWDGAALVQAARKRKKKVALIVLVSISVFREAAGIDLRKGRR
jgi:hypothetical protein